MSELAAAYNNLHSRRCVTIVPSPLAESKDCLNLFFCFRWLLVLFKREFSFETIQRLWEVWKHRPLATRSVAQ